VGSASGKNIAQEHYERTKTMGGRLNSLYMKVMSFSCTKVAREKNLNEKMRDTSKATRPKDAMIRAESLVWHLSYI